MATEEPQFEDSLNGGAVLIASNVSGASPVLEMVTAWVRDVPTITVPKLRAVGEIAIAGAPVVPVTVTVCGLSGALSYSLTTSLNAPAWVGAKVTPRVQLPPGCKVVDGQLTRLNE